MYKQTVSWPQNPAIYQTSGGQSSSQPPVLWEKTHSRLPPIVGIQSIFTSSSFPGVTAQAQKLNLRITLGVNQNHNLNLIESENKGAMLKLYSWLRSTILSGWICSSKFQVFLEGAKKDWWEFKLVVLVQTRTIIHGKRPNKSRKFLRIGTCFIFTCIFVGGEEIKKSPFDLIVHLYWVAHPPCWQVDESSAPRIVGEPRVVSAQRQMTGPMVMMEAQSQVQDIQSA